MQRLDNVFKNSFDQLLQGIFQPPSKKSSGVSDFNLDNLGDYIELYKEKKYLETEQIRLKKVLAKKNAVIAQIKQQILTPTVEIRENKKQFVNEGNENSKRSRLLADVSHELRTPLSGIISIAGLLQSSPLTKEQQKQVTIIEKCSQSLSLLINNLLDYSKIEAGALELEKTEFKLEETIQECIELLIFKAREKNLQLAYHLVAGVPTYLVGDPLRLRQILLNLVSNAIKFTKHGEVTVRVEPIDSPEKDMTVCFRVTDTGIGIPEAQHEKLFTRFAQAETSTTRKYGGSGLGLSISKELVERMGGQIGVESTEDIGSTFWFTSRFLKPEAAQRAANQTFSALDQPPSSTQNSLRILLVEDDLITRKISLMLLSKSGQADVDIAENGLEAVQKLQMSHYDLVLMDMQMPEMDGVEATRQIRQFSPNGPNSRVPIIAMTANTVDTNRAECLAAGMNGFVSKPLDTPELNRIVAHILQASSDPEEKTDEAESLDELPTLNLEQLNKLRGDIGQKFKPLARSFMDRLPTLIKKMQGANVDNNAQNLEETAHKLRGNSASFCAEKMADLCLKIERSAQDSRTGVSTLLARLEEEAQKITHILQSEIQNS